jgi:Asp/Glu/hydantoin racemase
MYVPPKLPATPYPPDPAFANRPRKKQTKHVFFTAPSGPNSINGPEDAAESAAHCLPAVRRARKPVTGIFEASMATSLQGARAAERFGIVSTGKVWETVLSAGVLEFLGFTGHDAADVEAMARASKRFAGVETTGLTAVELHETPPEEVRRRMKEATKRLVRKGDVGAICLGCAGMAGMDEMVREACVEELGEEQGSSIKIVDGVVAGAGWLEGAVRAGS